MNDIPQIITASIALLGVFLLGCIIGWFLRSTIFRTKQQQTADIQTPSTASETNVGISTSPVAQAKITAAKASKNAPLKSDTIR